MPLDFAERTEKRLTRQLRRAGYEVVFAEA
jgi:hypothetical protein